GKEWNRIGRRLAVFESDECHLVARANGAVPGAMLRDKCPAVIAGGKLLAAIERELQRSDVRAEQDIGNRGFGDEIRALRLHTGIAVGTDVAVGPAVKAAVLDAGEVIRRKIVAQLVALVDCNPRLSRDGL